MANFSTFYFYNFQSFHSACEFADISKGIVQENTHKTKKMKHPKPDGLPVLSDVIHLSLARFCLENRMHSVSFQIHKRCQIKVKHLSFSHFVVRTSEALKR